MSKFKVGDKIKIKEDLDDSDIDVVYSMLKYRGKIATIIRLDDDGADMEDYYRIDLDGEVHYWMDRMIEPAIKEYTIHNLIDTFPTETKFLSNDHLFRIQLGELQIYDEDMQEWRKSINSLKQILDMKFTKVEEPKLPKLKPMTFEEAVRTGNKIKYKFNENIKQYNFFSLIETMKILYESASDSIYTEGLVSDIILKGTWFAEGVYE